MIPQLELTLFGGVQFRCGGKLITGFRSSKAMALLCYLAVTAMPLPRSLAADLFWPELSESHANDSLRVTLSNLRSLVGSYLIITRQLIAFDLESPYSLDVRQFRDAVQGRAQMLPIERLREAADLYRGDFLAGFHVHDAPAFEQWASIQQMQLRDFAVRALHTLVVYYAQQSHIDHALAVEYSKRLLLLEPWEEETHRLLILLLAASGQPAAAQRQFEFCRSMLWKELEIEPSTETEEIVEQVCSGTLTTEDVRQQITAIAARLEKLPAHMDGSLTLSPAAPNANVAAYLLSGAGEGIIYE
jgi:DNA-binding SARP family transcriptional activator